MYGDDDCALATRMHGMPSRRMHDKRRRVKRIRKCVCEACMMPPSPSDTPLRSSQNYIWNSDYNHIDDSVTQHSIFFTGLLSFLLLESAYPVPSTGGQVSSLRIDGRMQEVTSTSQRVLNVPSPECPRSSGIPEKLVLYQVSGTPSGQTI